MTKWIELREKIRKIYGKHTKKIIRMLLIFLGI